MMFNPEDCSLKAALNFDKKDELAKFQEKFHFPKTQNAQKPLYFCGHSLGLMPKQTAAAIEEINEAWKTFAVDGHFHSAWPWVSSHESLSASLSRLVGAKESEVVAMNTLTVNLHLLLVSFYKPKKNKFKILIENNTFPSDKYAVDSHARLHGFDPKECVVELKPRKGEMIVREEDIFSQIEELGDSLALVMLGNCNYLSGQKFNMKAITEHAHRFEAMVGFNLAHGAGNIDLKLHEWKVDFATWCTYKYINSGPGGMAGIFIHEKYHLDKSLNRFEGWWGHNKKERFKMAPVFDPIPTAEAWQLSNPPMYLMASLKSSLQIFDEATMPRIAKKRDHITSYLEFLLKTKLKEFIQIQTPTERGSMLCLKVKNKPEDVLKKLKERGVTVDFREPDILRMTPIPLYNSYQDCFLLSEILEEIFN